MTTSNDIDTDPVPGDGGTTGGISRRRMIGATAAGGAAIWVAPAVAGVATGAAHGTPVPCPDCGGAEATAVNVDVLGVTVGPLGHDTTDDDSEVCVLDPDLSAIGTSASTVCGNVTSSCSAESSVEDLDMDLNTIGVPLTLSADTLQSNIQAGTGADCCGVDADTTIVNLTGDLGGTPLAVTALPDPGPNTTLATANVLGVGTVEVIANRQVCDGNEAVVQALYISLGTLGEIVIGESRVTMPQDCPCPFPPA